MYALTAIHHRILREVRLGLTAAGCRYPPENHRLLTERQQRAFCQAVQTQTPDLVLLDTLVLPRGPLAGSLRALRIQHPSLRLVLLCPEPGLLERQATELCALAIYDRIPYTASARGRARLLQDIPVAVTHPRSLPDVLSSLSGPGGEPPVRTPRPIVALAGLAPGSGVTHLSLHLSCWLENAGPVLLVEANAPRPVLSSFLLEEEGRDPRTGLCRLPGSRRIEVSPAENPHDWRLHLAGFSSVVLDLGTVVPGEDSENAREFLRSDLPLLVSRSAPWDMQRVCREKHPPPHAVLWIDGCPPGAFRRYRELLRERYLCLVSGRAGTDLLQTTREEERLFRRLFSLCGLRAP